MKKERFLRVFRCVIRTFSITAQQPVRISTSGQALVKLGPLSNTMVKTGSESVNKRLRYRWLVCDHPKRCRPKAYRGDYNLTSCCCNAETRRLPPIWIAVQVYLVNTIPQHGSVRSYRIYCRRWSRRRSRS